MEKTNPKTSYIVFQTAIGLALIGLFGGAIVGFVGGSNLGPLVGIIPAFVGFVLGLIIGVIRAHIKKKKEVN